jgi:hypothetical protein
VQGVFSDDRGGCGIDGSSAFVKNVGKEVAEGIERVQPISPLDRPARASAFVVEQNHCALR